MKHLVVSVTKAETSCVSVFLYLSCYLLQLCPSHQTRGLMPGLICTSHQLGDLSGPLVRDLEVMNLNKVVQVHDTANARPSYR